jgi:hypothetical protein
VSAQGGVAEIVEHPELVYRDPEDAAAKICAQLAAPAGLLALRESLQDRVARFRPECFAENLLGIVQKFLGQPLATVSVSG